MYSDNVFGWYKTNAIWEPQVTAVRHLAGVLHTAKKLSEKPLPGMEDLFLEMKEKSGKLGAIGRWNALFMMTKVNGMFDVITEYLRIAFQLDMISLIGLSRFIKAHQDTVRALYFMVGELDALCALSSVRASLPSCCLPEFSREKKVEIRGLTHPLVKNAVPNSISAGQNVLITGSNASGKSTFIKALAVNAIFAQTFYTCWAERFVMPRARVLTSPWLCAIRFQKATAILLWRSKACGGS